jgi:uncharacterized protein YbjT (DUF2867 family)
MKILLTGATGYIGKRLLPQLLGNGYEVVCCVREKSRFTYQGRNEIPGLTVIEADFLDEDSLKNIPDDIDAAYYLIHSMSAGTGSFEDMEARAATNFRNAMDTRPVEHVVYLSGIINDEQLSKHLESRKKVEEILGSGSYGLTTLRAGIIVGSGSASFEIIRDLVEKLPVMIAPRWLQTRTQPIAIRDVISFLTRVLLKKELYNTNFDIGGPDILTYKEMLLRFAKVRKLRRWIVTVPVMTPRLSSYWLYFITSTSFQLARNLVESMKTEVICRPNQLAEKLDIHPISYDQAIELAFDKIDQSKVESSWKDSMVSGKINQGLSNFIEVPTYGCFKDERQQKIQDQEFVLNRIWSIGGDTGWYYANWLWQVRGFLDKLVGGVGLRRGRTNTHEINPGDALDFWRVLLADRDEKRLLLFAEMKLPGEAWLEFRIDDEGTLYQTATFRPKGVLGRLYWYTVLPFHGFVFAGMIRNLSKNE